MPRFPIDINSAEGQAAVMASGGMPRDLYPVRQITALRSAWRAVRHGCRTTMIPVGRSAPIPAPGPGSEATTLLGSRLSGTASTSPFRKPWAAATRAAHGCCSKRASTTTARYGSTASATGSGAPLRDSTVRSGWRLPTTQPRRPAHHRHPGGERPSRRAGRRSVRAVHQPELRMARRRSVGQMAKLCRHSKGGCGDRHD